MRLDVCVCVCVCVRESVCGGSAIQLVDRPGAGDCLPGGCPLETPGARTFGIHHVFLAGSIGRE